jgi:cell wall-associated NlpC family hydrolase
MEAFELRLWDGRLGRWLTVDPNEQYDSPYLGMGNSPMNTTDPDGGTDGEPPYPATAGGFYVDENMVSYYGNADGSWTASTMLNEVVIETVKTMDPFKFDMSFNRKVDGAFSFDKSWARISVEMPTINTNPPNSEATIAASYKGDQRKYDMSDKPGTIDCSRFTRDVASKAGYTIPRVAYDQAKWYQRNGEWSNNLSQAEAGDHIFWNRGTKAYHTGIVLRVNNSANGIKIIVIQAQVFNHKPGSIHVQQLMSNGQMKGFEQPFVGVGRR